MARKRSIESVTGQPVISVRVESLPVQLTSQEVMERGQRLAQLEGDLAQHHIHAESVKKELKSRQTAIEAEISLYASIVRNKSEPREVQVQVEAYKKNSVREVRVDTGEVILERPIQEDERQGDLELLHPGDGE